MIPQPRPLIEVLAEIPDFRQSQGKRHALSSILALACCAVLCGYRSYSAMAAWGRNYGSRLTRALGFPQKSPCAATRHAILRHGDCEQFEQAVGTWAEAVAASSLGAQAWEARAVSLDGNTLRGSKKQGAPGVH
jgi:hypothetical protein